MSRLLIRSLGLLALLLVASPATRLVWAQVSGADQSPTAQVVPVNRLATDNLDLRPYASIWSDTASMASFATIDQLAKLSPFPSGILKAHGKQPTIWLRIQLHNPNKTDTLRRLFFGGYHVFWSLSQSDGQNRSAFLQHNGWMTSQSALALSDPFTLPLKVAPGKTSTVWFQTTGFGFFSAITPRLFTVAGYERFIKERRAALFTHFGYNCLVLGLCLFLSLFAAVQSIYARDITYAYWSLYLIATFLLLLFTTDFGFNLQFIGPTVAPLSIPLPYLIELAYLLFLQSFLQLDRYNPRLSRLISVAVYVLVVLLGISVWATLNLAIPIIIVEDQVFITTEILLLFILAAINRARIPNRHLFIVGSLGLIAMGFVASITTKLGLIDFDYFWTDPTVYFGFGVVFELTLFNLALSQRSRLTERAKQQLEHEKALENQRIHFITEQFQQRIAETEMAGLRSQMNPHFIFNCLNSIQYFTAQNDSEKASEYLTKFSRLIRLVLENSKSEKVTLANELETLRLYLDMEAMRFGQKVKYSIHVNDLIDTDSLQIPPLLLQPFVENAIWHGLMHKSEGGIIQISVEKPIPNFLHIEISDDGIGRQQAAEYKSKSATKNKSFGMKITADRIELINQLYRTQTQVQVVDLVDEQGYPAGTKVTIQIPV